MLEICWDILHGLYWVIEAECYLFEGLEELNVQWLLTLLFDPFSVNYVREHNLGLILGLESSLGNELQQTGLKTCHFYKDLEYSLDGF